MNATRRRVGTDEEPQSPQVPASQIATGLHDHSFTLQAIMELQKSSAEISTNLQTLKSSVDGVKSKVEDLVGWKNKIVGGAIAFGAICTVLGFVLSKASDYISFKQPMQISAPAK